MPYFPENSNQNGHRRPGAKSSFWITVGALVTLVAARAADIARPASSSTPASSSSNATRSAQSTTGAAVTLPTAAQVLTANRDAVAMVRALQSQARDAASLAKSGKPSLNGLVADANVVKDGTGMKPGGLVVDPQVLADWKAGLTASPLWTGAGKPVATVESDGSATNVKIVQTAQQAVLNWETFNVDRTTTVQFDQSAGGSNVSQWIAFNKVGVTGAPSQILGKIQTVGAGSKGGLGSPGSGGQVYVINPNGIIFGGSSQVDTHALVASSLQINDNLLKRGLVNNPDSQFLFTSLEQSAGSQTPAFSPVISDMVSVVPTVAATSPSFDSNRKVSSLNTVALNLVQSSNPDPAANLQAGVDYTVSEGATPGSARVTLTDSGFVKASGKPVRLSYTPIGDQNGDVTVLSGALLRSPTSAEHVGGRIALVGPNVTNKGEISTPDGQTILAAGLQVGMAAHNTSDASLRGLDVYVGAVSVDPAIATRPGGAGTAKNDGTYSKNALTAGGLIEAPRGNVTIAGKNVVQNGIVDSSTSVSLNGRIDLLADYGAVVNTQFQGSPETESPFWFSQTGAVSLGAGSVSQIVPKDPEALAGSSASTPPETTIGYQLALPSLFNIRGKTVRFGENSLLYAPGARVPSSTGTSPIVDNAGSTLKSGVTVRAGTWYLQGLDSPTPYRDFFFDASLGSQVYFAPGANIDVSGSKDVTASVAENYVDVELRGSELANSPLQRDGALRGKTITVDSRVHGPWDPTLNNGLGGYTWIGTPLADTSGYVGLVKRTVGQLTTSGGTVSIKSGSAVVMQSGSQINVSGGSIQYGAANVSTTKVSSQGHIYDISEASPDRVYDGIVGKSVDVKNASWSVTDSYGNTHFLTRRENGYTQGASAGALELSSSSLALDGTFVGTTTVGPLQRTIVPHDTEAMRANALLQFQSILRPDTASLSLALEGYHYDATRNNPLAFYSPYAPTVNIQGTSKLKAPDVWDGAVDENGSPTVALRADRTKQVDLDLVRQPNLFGLTSFGRVSIKNLEGSVFLNPNVTLYLGHAGGLSVNASNIDIEGALIAPGGDLKFTASNFSPYREILPGATEAPAVTPDQGKFILGSAGLLDVSGWVVDDRVGANLAGELPWSTKGGTVSINAYDATLKKTVLKTEAQVQRGGGIDVSGGVLMNSSSRASYGDAGKISVRGGVDPTSPILGQSTDTLDSLKGSLTLGSTLSGMSGNNGGSLEIGARSIYVGPNASPGDSVVLSPDFFNQGGFSHFKLSGVGEGIAGSPGKYKAGVTVGDYVFINPQVKHWKVAGFQGTPLSLVSMNYFETEPALYGPTSLTFISDGIDATDPSNPPYARGDIVFGSHSQVLLNPNASSFVKIAGRTVDLLGKISVSGGTISVAGSNNSTLLGFDTEGSASRQLPTVHLGDSAILSTAGSALSRTNLLGYRTGTVLKGGTINVSGNIVAEGRKVDATGKVLAAGATLDVSGGSGTLDFVSTQLNSTAVSGGLFYESSLIESDAGTIKLAGARELWVDANLIGKAGGSTASGGTLEISSGRVDANNSLVTSDVTLVVNKSGNLIPDGFYKEGLPVIGHAFVPELLAPEADNLVMDENGAPIYVLDSDGKPVYELGHFSLSKFTDGKFDNLALNGTVKFSGDMDLTAKQSISVGNSGFLFSSGRVKLTAPNVVLGTPFQAPFANDSLAADRSAFKFANGPFYKAPTFGAGSLDVSASLIDVGNLSLQGIGKASLSADKGDIRGDGSLDIAGNLSLRAGQIYPATAVDFNLAAYRVAGVVQSGTVEIKSSTEAAASRPLPWSAAGHLGIYANEILQGGVLRAPLGTISLGWDGTGTAPIDPQTNLAYEKTSTVRLLNGSETSVSAVDPVTKKGLMLPYGFNVNGTSWYDPAGSNITLTGVAESKRISVAGTSVFDEAGSRVDVSGGGDLYSYRWVSGTNGTVDLLNATGVFAIVPSYSANYAPYAPFNDKAKALSKDSGYVSGNDGSGKSGIGAGDRIYLAAFAGRPAGYYTLLPARYALLPGAYLVTPKSGVPNGGTVSVYDGSYLVSGYRDNAFNSSRTSQRPLYSVFEVASGTALTNNADGSKPSSVVRTRAQYDDYFGNVYFPENAAKSSLPFAPDTPRDSGQLVFSASDALSLRGKVVASSIDSTGRGGLVDISSSKDVEISDTAGVLAGSGSEKLMLDSKDLSAFGAESLLIGGVRNRGTDGTILNVSAANLSVDNKGTNGGLSGIEIILVANRHVDVAADSIVSQVGAAKHSDEKLIIRGSARLENEGDTLVFQSGGRAISIPSGTGSGTLTSSVDGYVTLADGSTKVPFLKEEAFSVPEGGKVTLSAGGSLAYSGLSEEGAITAAVGDGAMIRVSANPDALAVRDGVTTLKGSDSAAGGSSQVAVSVADGAVVSGGSGNLVLDSTGSTSIGGLASVSGNHLGVSSSQISLVLSENGFAPTGLVLTKTFLDHLANGTQNLSLSSYSSIDLYGGPSGGSFGSESLNSLSFHAAQIRGFGEAGEETVPHFSLTAKNLVFDNSIGGSRLSDFTQIDGTPFSNADLAKVALKSTLELSASNLFYLGRDGIAGSQSIDQFGAVTLKGAKGIEIAGKEQLSVSGDIALLTDKIVGKASAKSSISAAGDLSINKVSQSDSKLVSGLGASLSLSGSNVTVASTIEAKSGSIELHATGEKGVVRLTGTLDVSGSEKIFHGDLYRNSSAGSVSLTADFGDVIVLSGSHVLADAALSTSPDVAPGGRVGNAGSISVRAPYGVSMIADGTLSGKSGKTGVGGSFFLDVAGLNRDRGVYSSISGFSALSNYLVTGGFDQEQVFRFRQGDVVLDSLNTKARYFTVSADGSDDTASKGNIKVAGKIDASGLTGGSIEIQGRGSVVVDASSVLSVRGADFDAAGKGGRISLGAGAAVNGVENSTSDARDTASKRFDDSVAAVDVRAGASLDLSVASASTDGAIVEAAKLGKTTGVLHLRAPQTGNETPDIQINPLASGTVIGASRIEFEGFKVYSPKDGLIDTPASKNVLSVKDQIAKDGARFASAANTTTILSFLGSQYSQSLLHLQPGAEVVNYADNGNLTLAKDWDLSSVRFGNNIVSGQVGSGEVGVLTLRAKGNLVFNGALSDGFDSTRVNSSTGKAFSLWQERLLDAGSDSWSFRLAAGSDSTSALFSSVVAADRDSSGRATSGSLLLGKSTNAVSTTSGLNATSIAAITPFYQVIRTGTGNIDIFTGGDVQLLNQFASIYTAGQLAPDQTLGGTFDVPEVVLGTQASLGAVQQRPFYPAQFASGGGNVAIHALGDVARLYKRPNGTYDDDSSQQLPNNWLYRRGYVDPSTGTFGRHVAIGGGGGDIMSTSWWVDYSNFFQGVGALGGGNVSVSAGGSVRNVDAVVPTNARMSGVDTNGNALKPDASKLVELGGGNLSISAGDNIDAGVYYVERGKGNLQAGGSVVTNATRDPTLAYVGGPSGTSQAEQWLPTTLFLGKGQFEVTANDDLLLGPVANTFLLPQGINNSYWYKTYFSTYAAESSVAVTSLNGEVSLRGSSDAPLLSVWYNNLLRLEPNTENAAFYRPWLRLSETSIESLFDTASTLLPPTLSVTSLNSNINTVGRFNLAPSPHGTLDLAAAGSINALQSVGPVGEGFNDRWAYSTFNLSDASPASMPSVTRPISLSVPIPTDSSTIGTGTGWNQTQNSTETPFFGSLDGLFNESGSVLGPYGVLQSKQALHDATLLHLNDHVPVHIYAGSGNISGIELFSSKPVRFIAAQDIRDVGLYIQNLRHTDTTVVSAGRDIVLFDPSSPLRLQALANGNELTIPGATQTGDVQISGPGYLNVFAGRNLDFGAGRPTLPSIPSDLSVGITSVGDARNPFLKLNNGGANVVVAAGLKNAGIGGGSFDFTTSTVGLVNRFLDPTRSDSLAATYLPKLGEMLEVDSKTANAEIWKLYKSKSTTEQDRLALSFFYIVLRTAGRNFNDPKSADFGTYRAGYRAIASVYHGSMDFSQFESTFLNPSSGNASVITLPWFVDALGLPSSVSANDAWASYASRTDADRKRVAAQVFGAVLDAPSFDVASAPAGKSSAQIAIDSVFSSAGSTGEVSLSSKEIRTKRGGSIQVLAPSGGVTLGTDLSTSLAPPGILTESGGSIGIFARNSVNVGTSRVFTLRGGDEVLWSTVGDIGAGRSSKTVKSAPPTQVTVDPQSADVATDIAGLATGGGIGVLAAVANVKAGNVDLIAPAGTVDAGDAGIRSTGNLNIAALHVVNSGNISVGGASTGGQVQAAPPSLASVAAASSTGASAAGTVSDAVRTNSSNAVVAELPSLISVEVLGYGGDDEEEEDDSDGAPNAERITVPSALSLL